MINPGRKFTTLNEDQIWKIHRAALEILEHVGNKVEEEEALQLLKNAGCRIDHNSIVKVPSSVVEEAIHSAPKRIVLADRLGNRRLFLEEGNSYFSPTAACPRIYDVDTGEKRDWTKQDIANVSILVDHLPNMDAIFPLGSLAEEYGTQCFIHEFDAMVRNTTKPIIYLAHGMEDLQVILDMAAAVAGGEDQLRENPFLLFYDEVLAPLYHKRETVAKMLLCAGKGLPVRYGSLTMSGASSPCTMAGVLAQSYAEALFGLVMVQLKRRGTPFMMAILPGIMDLQVGTLSSGAPEYYQLQVAYAEICRYFRLPVMTTNGISDAKIPDGQAAVEATLGCWSAYAGGSQLSIGAGSLECHLIGSLEMIALADEVISMIKRVYKGIEVDANGLALQAIGEVGPRGNYLGHAHTLKNFKTAHWRPTVMDRNNYETWEQLGSKTMLQRLREKVQKILADHHPLPLPERLSEQLDRLVGTGAANKPAEHVEQADKVASPSGSSIGGRIKWNYPAC